MSRDNDLAGTLKKGAISSLAVKITGAGLAFITHVAFARLMGTTSYGIYVYALTWVTMISVFAKLGLDSVALKFIPVYLVGHRYPLLRGLVKTCRRYAIFSSIFFSIGTIAVSYLLLADRDNIMLVVFFFSALHLPAMVLMTVEGSFLQAFKKVVHSEIAQKVVQPILLTCAVTILYFTSQEQVGAIPASIITVACGLVSLALVVIMVSNFWPDGFYDAEPDFSKASEWKNYGITLLLISGFSLLISNTDIVMLGILNSTTSAGIYAATAKSAGLVSFGLMAVNAIVAPTISQLYTERRFKTLQSMLTKSARAILVFTICASLPFIFFGRFFLSFFGPDFLIGATPLAILVGGHIVNATAGSVGYILIMTGRHKIVTIAFGASALANIILNYLLIPVYGLEGAAFATAVTTAFWNIALFIYIIKNLGFNSCAFPFMLSYETKIGETK